MLAMATRGCAQSMTLPRQALQTSG
jgi:hypothetical protein